MRTLYGKNYYSPREIAKAGLITNSTGGDNENSNYDYILWLIKDGQLKAKNYGRASQPRWLVSADEIERYRQKETSA